MNTLRTWLLNNLDSVLTIGAAIGAVAVWLLEVGIKRGWIATGDDDSEGTGRLARRPRKRCPAYGKAINQRGGERDDE